MKYLNQILTQDNFGTRSPFFVVYCKRQFPIDSQFSDQTPVYINTSSGEVEEISEEEYEKVHWKYLMEDWTYENKPQINGIDFNPVEWEPVYYEEINEFKQVFFTRAAAEEYIEKNKHNLRLPWIDCDSFYRNPEMESVRKMLIEMARKVRDTQVTV